MKQQRFKPMTPKEFDRWCLQIKKQTSIPLTDENPIEKSNRIKRLKTDYNAFFKYYFPNFAKSDNAWFHNYIAHELKKNQLFKALLEWFRGSAKSTHATMGYPLFLMVNDELRNMMLIGQTETKAKRLLASIQAQLKSNQRFINDYGEQVNIGTWEDGEFITKDGIAFYALGMGQSPRGTRNEADRPDFIVCDDLDSKQLSRNPKRVQDYFEWIEDDVMGCFDIGRERFLLVNNGFAKCSILKTAIENFLKGGKRGKLPVSTKTGGVYYTIKDNWHHLRVDAVDNIGNPTWKEKYTRKYWQDKKDDISIRSWLREYMNTPVEEGRVFKQDWIKWKVPYPLKDYDYLITYCDPSLKNTATSDYKAVRFWGKKGSELHLIKSFVRKCSIKTMVQFFYDLEESLPEGIIVDYFMEEVFLQDLLFDEFASEGDERGYQLPIRGDKRKKPDKFLRIESTSPLYERGFVYYNANEKEDPDMQRGIDHLLAFEEGSGAPDDAPDADEGAIYILQRKSRATSTHSIIGKRNKKAY